METEKSSCELVNFVVSNGRVMSTEDGKFVWESLANEIEYEACDRGWDTGEVRDALEWAWNAMEHTGR